MNGDVELISVYIFAIYVFHPKNCMFKFFPQFFIITIFC